ncbi:hypothetical protein KSP40_PGU009656 [Platanthera guangdongensis]|uniref:Beta-ketoacyl-[acyl-carrier-protein] synthase III N-terminal domain-containing protein n=1 Tax=Platanthera guangdongensis TaxID=2320717 RepID=A0ABR2LKE7_9ASPA
MAAALGLVSPQIPCIRWGNLAPCSVSRPGVYLPERNPMQNALRCCALERCVDDSVLGATSSSKQTFGRIVSMGSKLVGCGSVVPKATISNDDLAQFVETSDEWIHVRTGIRNRRVLTGDETLTRLALEAASEALHMAGITAVDVDLIIMCTSTPDDLFGGGSLIQRDLGCKNAWTFDITAACSGFVVGLITATRFIKGGGYKNILVIGADALSRYVDWTDRGICILFGDAAGAVLVQACDADEDGLLGFDLHSDDHGHRYSSSILFIYNFRYICMCMCLFKYYLWGPIQFWIITRTCLQTFHLPPFQFPIVTETSLLLFKITKTSPLSFLGTCMLTI